jgi:hypothetical protein
MARRVDGRLQFLIQLAEVDLDASTTEEKRRLVDGLGEFLRSPMDRMPVRATIWSEPGSGVITAAHIEHRSEQLPTLQRICRSMLHLLANGRDYLEGVVPEDVKRHARRSGGKPMMLIPVAQSLVPSHKQIECGVSPEAVGRDLKTSFYISGEWPAVFNALVSLAISETGSFPVRRCANQECRRFFVPLRSDSRTCHRNCYQKVWVWQKPAGRRSYKRTCAAQGWSAGARKRKWAKAKTGIATPVQRKPRQPV